MKTILLIDDDEQLRKTFALALRANGYHVLEANSGLTGLAMARQHLPDLILTDIHMPGGDGATLLKAIRHDPEVRTKQVVLMTGRPDLVTPRRGMEEGADDFLVKPVSLDALLSCVKARFIRASINWRVEDQLLADLKSAVPSQLPHEFFTPLAGVIGLLEILRSSFSLLTSEEVIDIHNDAYLSAVRLHHTLRNYLLILDLQASPAETLLAPMSPFQVQTSIEMGVKDALRLNDRKQDITLRVNAGSLFVSPQDLSLMVEELVDNSCKFSRSGTPVEVNMNAQGRLSVTDQGRGMTPEEINRIGAFQQFERKKQEQQGLGLGLVLVVKLAARCDAEFSMTSQPGKGTKVSVVFSPPKQAMSFTVT